MKREVRIDNCKHILEWDYKGYDKVYQQDWNQTLIVKINNIGAHIYQNSRRGGPNTIKLHPSLLPLIETLEYYNKDEKTLAGRFNVITDNEVEQDIIYIYNSDDVFTIPIITGVDWGMIEFKLVGDCTEEMVKEYIESTQGYVKVLNYFDNTEEQYNPYCPICDSCGEDGCCSRTSCKQHPEGKYCETYLKELKFGYLMYHKLSELIDGDEKYKSEVDKIWDELYDKVFKDE